MRTCILYYLQTTDSDQDPMFHANCFIGWPLTLHDLRLMIKTEPKYLANFQNCPFFIHNWESWILENIIHWIPPAVLTDCIPMSPSCPISPNSNVPQVEGECCLHDRKGVVTGYSFRTVLQNTLPHHQCYWCITKFSIHLYIHTLIWMADKHICQYHHAQLNCSSFLIVFLKNQ